MELDSRLPPPPLIKLTSSDTISIEGIHGKKLISLNLKLIVCFISDATNSGEGRNYTDLCKLISKCGLVF